MCASCVALCVCRVHVACVCVFYVLLFSSFFFLFSFSEECEINRVIPIAENRELESTEIRYSTERIHCTYDTV
jgi:hypothetical protein